MSQQISISEKGKYVYVRQQVPGGCMNLACVPHRWEMRDAYKLGPIMRHIFPFLFVSFCLCLRMCFVTNQEFISWMKFFVFKQ
jgi:hypothetical protein